MKRLLWIIVCSTVLLGSLITRGQGYVQELEVNEDDSLVSVIGYFTKTDTLTYVIGNTIWKWTPEDTVKTAGFVQKVQLAVADSTATGYKIDFTILEISGDTIEDSGAGDGFVLNKIITSFAENINKKMSGKTIRFETDEVGAITKFNNLDKIKNEVKKQFKDEAKILSGILRVLNKQLFDNDSYKLTDTDFADGLINFFLEDIKLLFIYHGQSFNIGELSFHEDAANGVYENDTYINVAFNSENGTYQIISDINNFIPRSLVKQFLAGLVESMDDESVSDSFNSEFDEQVKDDCIENYFTGVYYMYEGWPYKIVKQKNTSLGDMGQTNQTSIYLESYK